MTSIWLKRQKSTFHFSKSVKSIFYFFVCSTRDGGKGFLLLKMSTQRDQTKNQYRCWKSESGAGFSARSRDRYILPYRRTRRGPIPEPIRTLPPNDARRKNKRTLTVHPHFF
ncbi:hypothetical protein CDAR_107931 [Caerostris darwini]|uniref:Uncharacterized protein n=1 Tax=Caerostris darwini TaxID=1538125 RepID=A0AAV4X4Z8_9ARAC|nr:hypothetical protein CDAR_107931 [Caerostris darwini]